MVSATDASQARLEQLRNDSDSGFQLRHGYDLGVGSKGSVIMMRDASKLTLRTAVPMTCSCISAHRELGGPGCKADQSSRPARLGNAELRAPLFPRCLSPFSPLSLSLSLSPRMIGVREGLIESFDNIVIKARSSEKGNQELVCV
jgi:hypothetical protein